MIEAEYLREAPGSVNNYNIDGAKKNNKLGVRGVHIHQGKYRACIRHKGKFKHLGCFDTVEEASAVYNKELQRLTGLL